MRLESVSLRILPLLQEPGLQAVAESAFAEACNFVTAGQQRFALVSPRIGNGPLSVVVSPLDAVSLLQKGQTLRGDGRFLQVGPGFRLDLAQAQPWEPRPAYEKLARWPQIVAQNLALLRDRLPLEAPRASLLARPAYSTQGAFGSRPSLALVQSQAASLTDGFLQAYRTRQLDWLLIFARRLAGLGPGLTPAGDDWLAGWLVGLRARNALAMEQGNEISPALAVENISGPLLRAINGRTTGLSMAFLAAAAEGAVPQSWHHLIEALSRADTLPLRMAASEILRQGATSGADMLAGFLAAFQTAD